MSLFTVIQWKIFMREGDTIIYIFTLLQKRITVEEVLRYHMNNQNVLLPSEVDVVRGAYASIAQYVNAPVNSPR